MLVDLSIKYIQTAFAELLRVIDSTEELFIF
jgi:hypothetical protein